MIRWDPAGDHIIVERPEQLALHVLPSVYRQSRFASFSRQLNVGGCSHYLLPHILTIFFPTLPPPRLTALRFTASCAKSTYGTSIPPLTIPTLAHGVSD